MDAKGVNLYIRYPSNDINLQYLKTKCTENVKDKFEPLLLKHTSEISWAR